MRASKISAADKAARKKLLSGRRPHHLIMLLADGDVTAAWLLDYLVSWWPSTVMKGPDGFWIVRSLKQVKAETRLTTDQVRRGLKLLEEYGTVNRKKALWNVEGKGNLIHLWVQLTPTAESTLWASGE